MAVASEILKNRDDGMMTKEDIERIYSNNRAFMFGVALNHVHYKDTAEDVVQEAALILLRQRKVPDDERGLAYTMANYASHSVLDYQRAGNRDIRKTDDIEEPQQISESLTSPSAETCAIKQIELEDAIRIAPQAVVFNALGYTAREISEASGKKQKAIESKIRRFQVRHYR